MVARAARSPARRSPSPAPAKTPKSNSKTPTTTPPKTRALYFSDGDTRPTYRGAFYRWINRTGVAWLVLGAYVAFACVDARTTAELLTLISGAL